MSPWLDISLVSALILLAVVYLVRRLLQKKSGSGNGCGTASSCGDQCRLALSRSGSKKD